MRLAMEAGEDARSVAEAVSAVDPAWRDEMAEARSALHEAAI